MEWHVFSNVLFYVHLTTVHSFRSSIQAFRFHFLSRSIQCMQFLSLFFCHVNSSTDRSLQMSMTLDTVYICLCAIVRVVWYYEWRDFQEERLKEHNEKSSFFEGFAFNFLTENLSKAQKQIISLRITLMCTYLCEWNRLWVYEMVRHTTTDSKRFSIHCYQHHHLLHHHESH